MKNFKRTLAMLLVSCMLIGGAPLTSFAADITDSTEATVVETADSIVETVDFEVETMEAIKETEEVVEEESETIDGITEINEEATEVTEETTEDITEVTEETTKATEGTTVTTEEIIEAIEETTEANEETEDATEETAEDNESTEHTEDPYGLIAEDIEAQAETSNKTDDGTNATDTVNEDNSDIKSDVTTVSSDESGTVASFASGTCGTDVTWVLSDDGELTIIGSGKMDDYLSSSTPSPWSDYADQIKSVDISSDITHIGSGAFEGCTNLVDILIPDSVSSIGWRAFYDCDSLEFIELPEGITVIEACLFSLCDNLAEIYIPDSVTTIKNQAFMGCSQLSNIVFPDNLNSIWDVAFSGCVSLENIVIPNSVTNIGDSAFSGCDKLTNIVIPQSVTCLGDYSVFANCSSLTNIEVEEGNTYYCSEDGILFDKEQLSILSYPAGKVGSYSVQESINTIGTGAFSGCKNLTEINIPDSVNSIGKNAFSECTGLKSVTLPKEITEIEEWTFAGCSGLTSVKIPTSVNSIGRGAFNMCNPSTIIYEGSEEQWSQIYIDDFNDTVYNASIYYNGENPLDGAQELLLDQMVEVTIDEAGTKVYFSFVPEKTKKYSFESIGVYDSYVTLKDSYGETLICNDDGGDGTNFRISTELTAGEKYIFEVRMLSAYETGSFNIYLYEAQDLVLEEAQEITIDDINKKYMGVFVPDVSGAYQFSCGENDNIIVEIYDENGVSVREYSGTGLKFRMNLEAGKEYSAYVRLFETGTVSIMLNKVSDIQRVEVIYNGSTETYYELNSEYYSGYNASGTVINIYLEDGSCVTANYYDNVCGEYNIGYECRNRDGSQVLGYDENNKYPVGEYRAVFTIGGEDYGIGVDYTIKNASEIDTILTVDQSVTGLGAYVNNFVKIIIEESGDYKLKSTCNGSFELWDENFENLGYESSFYAEAGTYYVRVTMNSDFELSLKKVMITELTLAQNETVTIEEAGNIAYFSFIPEITGYYSLESFGNYDTYVNVKDSAGNYICSDDDGGDANNFKTYEKLIAGEKYIFEVRFYSGTLTGAFEICLSEALEIVEVVAEYSSYNTGKLYYGLNLRQYHSVANGLIFKTIYKDGTVESVAFENGAYNYFSINIADKETSNYVDYDENGYMPTGTYTITIQSKLNDELTDTIEVQVLPPEELDLTLTLESPVTNLPGYASNTSGIMPYSCFKIEIPAEGRYELASTESNCYGALYDENMIPVIGGANSYYSMDLITIEADSAATYYMVTYANSAGEYDISMSKQKEMVSLSVVEPYTDTLYNVMGNNSVSNVISSKVGLLATLDDESEVFFNVYSNEWRNYGLSYNLYASDNFDEPIISSERSNLPVGDYEIHITSTVYGDILCVIPFTVTTADQAEEIALGEEVTNSVITTMYKVEVEQAGAYELKYGDNCNYYVQVGLLSGDSVSRYISKACAGTGSSYVQLEQGTNYILIRNYNAPDTYKFSLHKMPDIVSLEHVDEEKTTFEYGYWGYYVRESVSGGKITVSSSANKKPLVSNSPVDYYRTVSGVVTTTRVSAFNFDVNLEAERDDGSIIEIFCNSFLWQAYDLVQSILNLDGSPVYTDQNGFVEIGDYIAEFSVGDVSVEIPFSVTESDSVKDIRKTNVEIEAQKHTGEAITPIPVITYNDTLLTMGTDYTVSYKNNIDVGLATVTIKGINGYSGTLTAEFTILGNNSKVVASGYSGYTTWKLTDDGVLAFSGAGNMRTYAYKSEMPWYKYIDQITSVVLEEGVTNISNYAFYGMPNLKSVTIPESVTTIGIYAFKNCTALNDIVLPDNLTYLGESAFYGCTALTAIEIPASLWTIQPYTFKNCTALAEVTLHEGNLMKISEAAFYGTALREVTLPDCLDILDIYVFKNCSKLATVTLSESMTQIREAAFYGTSIETIEIPDSITSIGNYAFRKCEALQSVKFSQNLVTIGESAFYGCTALTEIALPESVETIKGYAFKSCTALKSVNLSGNLVTLGESALYGCTALTEIVIPENVATVGEYCFSRSTGLTNITFTGNAPNIGSGAFSKVFADVYYPTNNTTWTSEVMQNYGGTLNWVNAVYVSIEEAVDVVENKEETIGEETRAIEVIEGYNETEVVNNV